MTLVMADGVCVFVRKELPVTRVDIHPQYDHIELLCFDLYGVTGKLRFFCVYRPPRRDNKGLEYLQSLMKCISHYSSTGPTNVVLGDLNCPNINWYTGHSSSDCINSKFASFVAEFGLYQFVDFPTRGSNILDVILSDKLLK